MSRRRIATRYLALFFTAAAVYTLWRAVMHPSAPFIADVVLYAGLAVLYSAIVREGKGKR